MSRPRTGNAVKDITLSLSKKNLPNARKLAFKMGISLSEMVDRLLVAEMTGQESIAAKHGRTLQLSK